MGSDAPHFNFTKHHPLFFGLPTRLRWGRDPGHSTSPGSRNSIDKPWKRRCQVTQKQGVKACLRPVWNITALRQTWTKCFIEWCGNASPSTAMYDLPEFFRTEVQQKPAKLSPNPTFHLGRTSIWTSELSDILRTHLPRGSVVSSNVPSSETTYETTSN